MHRLYKAYSAKHPSASASASVSASWSASASHASGYGFSSVLTFLNFGNANDDYEDPFSKYIEMVVEMRDNLELSNELDIYLMEIVEF